jgi:hypothetical protein
MRICKALLKHGTSNFSLIIIEFVPAAELDVAERHWISVLKPFYNVSSGGTIDYTHSEGTKARISAALTGVLNPFFGKTHTAASILLNSLAHSAGFVYLYTSQNVLLIILPSLLTLSKVIKANHATIKSYAISGDLFRGGWYIRSVPLNYVQPPLFDHDSKAANDIYGQIRRDFMLRKPVFLFDAESKAFITRHDTVLGAAQAIGVHHNTITAAIKQNGIVNGFIVSGHRVLL